MKKRLWKRVKFYAGAWFGVLLLRILFLFSRDRIINLKQYEEIVDSGRSVVLALWHGPMLTGIYLMRNRGIHAMVGYHRDAEMIARILKKLGYEMIRGSSRDRGKEALNHALRVAKQPGNVVAITTDGPIGPYRKCKPGAAIIAQATGAAVIPLATNCSRKKVITNSWDRFYLPLPVARNVVVLGDPIFPEQIEGAHQTSQLLELIETRLADLQNEVDRYFEK